MRRAHSLALLLTLSLAGCSLVLTGENHQPARDGGAVDGACSPELSPPANGSLDRTSGVEGDVATYSCSLGYVLTGNGGSSTRTCQASGAWSGTEPACSVVVCSGARAPANGTVSASSATYDNIVTYSCDAGFRLEGSSFARCTASGAFTFPDGPLACVGFPCSPSLMAPANGSVDRMEGGTGDVATYSCDSGYYLVGERARACQVSGSWSASAPTCPSTGGYPVWRLPGTPGVARDYEVRTSTVLDRVTGLEWQREIERMPFGTTIGNYTWAEAQTHCADLVLDGRSDWRLPTRIELMSIVDDARPSPTIDPSAFPSTPSRGFWSSSPDAVAAGSAWAVSFNTGGSYRTDVADLFRVRCVR